jgi:hypothetical protein
LEEAVGKHVRNGKTGAFEGGLIRLLRELSNLARGTSKGARSNTPENENAAIELLDTLGLDPETARKLGKLPDYRRKLRQEEDRQLRRLDGQ